MDYIEWLKTHGVTIIIGMVCGYAAAFLYEEIRFILAVYRNRRANRKILRELEEKEKAHKSGGRS